MASPLKNLLKHSSVYAMATYLQRTIGFILIPVFTRPQYLPIESFADYNLIFTFIAFMTVFFTMGQDAAFLRFRFLNKNERAENVFVTSFFNLCILILLFSFVIVSWKNQILHVLKLDRESYIFFAIFILGSDVLSNSLYNWLRAEEKSIRFSMIKIGRFTIELFLNFYLVVFKKLGIDGILLSNAIAAALNLLVLITLNYKCFNGRWNASLSRDMIWFGLPFIPNGIAFIATEFSDRILIVHILDKHAQSIYSANYKWGTLIQFLVLAFRNAWQPFFLKQAKDTPEEAPTLFANTSLALFSGLTLIWLAGALFLKYFLIADWPFLGSLLGATDYWEGTKIIPLVLLSYVYYGVYVSLTPGFYIKKKGTQLALITIFGFIINLVINLIFLPRFGIISAAWATFAAYLSMVLIIYLTTLKVYPIPIKLYLFFKVMILQAIVIFYTFYEANSFLLSVLIFIVIVATLWLWVGKGSLKGIKIINL